MGLANVKGHQPLCLDTKSDDVPDVIHVSDELVSGAVNRHMNDKGATLAFVQTSRQETVHRLSVGQGCALGFPLHRGYVEGDNHDDHLLSLG